MKTVQEKIEGKCYVWAHPKSEWQLGQDIKAAGEGNEHTVMPFYYRITNSDTSYSEGTVLVHKFDVVGTIPAGIDLVKAAIQTLRDEITTSRKAFEKKEAELEEKIKSLAMITYNPE